MRRTQIYLEQEQAARLDERAAAAGTTRSGLIRNAIGDYLDRTEGGDETARLARFRAAVDEAFGVAPDLPRGEDYVRKLRAADRERDEELERRWRA